MQGLTLMEAAENFDYTSVGHVASKKLPFRGEHKIKAFPVNPCKQLHIGMWLTTSH